MDLKPLVTLFIVANPMFALPYFLHCSRNLSTRQRHQVIAIASLTELAVIVICALGGKAMLAAAGISLASFQVASGLLLLLTGLHMLAVTGRETEPENAPVDSRHWLSHAVAPLGVPLLAGPATITTAIILAERGRDSAAMAGLLTSVVIVVAITAACLLLAQRLSNYLGEAGMRLLTPLVGLVVAALAVEVMARGLLTLFPALL